VNLPIGELILFSKVSSPVSLVERCH